MFSHHTDLYKMHTVIFDPLRSARKVQLLFIAAISKQKLLISIKF